MNIADRFALALSGVNLKTVPLHHNGLSAYALNHHGKPALLVKLPPGFDRDVDGTRGIDVQVDRTGAVHRFISFRSEAVGMTAMFTAVVESLLESSSSAVDADTALELLLDNFEQLQSMFASRGGLLTSEEIRGFFAELLLLLQLRDAGYSAEAAVNAWQGPFRVAKDFILTDGRCIEVKSRRRVNHRIKIANVDQLDPRDEELRLAVVPLEKCAPGDGLSLLDLIADISSWMGDTPSARVAFAHALSMLGFDVEDPHYQRWHFQQADWKWFSVRSDFPRIRPADVPAAVSNVAYTLDIDQLDDYVSGPFWTEQD